MRGISGIVPATYPSGPLQDHTHARERARERGVATRDLSGVRGAWEDRSANPSAASLPPFEEYHLMRRTPLLLSIAACALVGFVPAAVAANLRGTDGNDTLTGTANADNVVALAGDDTVTGDAGADVIAAGAGNDTVDAGPGSDVVMAGPGNDTVDGGDGDDRLFSGYGSDTLRGGAGNDRLHAGARDGSADVLDCGDGDADVAFVRAGDQAIDCEVVRVLEGAGGSGDDTKVGTDRRDTMFGFAGNDTLSGLGGRDRLFGGTGNDALDGGTGSDWLFGQSGTDSLLGGDGFDSLWGQQGDDTLDGGAGNDRLWAGAGVDHLQGGAGDDHLHATANDMQVDTLDCGDGTDIAFVRPGDTTVNCETVRTVTVTNASES
jgi:Ca2+-binding RTX toxin-like protein